MDYLLQVYNTTKRRWHTFQFTEQTQEQAIRRMKTFQEWDKMSGIEPKKYRIITK